LNVKAAGIPMVCRWNWAWKKNWESPRRISVKRFPLKNIIINAGKLYYAIRINGMN
jgi:hypothetical protein